MIQVLQRGCDILEYLAAHRGRAVPLGELAAALDLHAATAARILKTWVNRGYASQARPKGGYRLGPMVFLLGYDGNPYQALIEAAEATLDRYVEATEEAVVLAVLQQGLRYEVAHREGRQTIQVREEVLHRDDPRRTATGQLLLAHLAPEQLDAWAARHAPDTEWREALERIRGRGRAQVERLSEVLGLALPVTQRGRTIAALGTHLPKTRFRGPHRKSIEAHLKQAAVDLSAALADLPDLPAASV